jgi:pimeloyl-ACP methyl ester carboxylesterase
MKENVYDTASGPIHYWINIAENRNLTLLFLPGLTADHRLFDKQIECFRDKYNVFVWDPPAHAASWPFRFDFTLMDQAKWLYGILEKENILEPVIVGQSMGGYVGQAFANLYPESLKGYIAIDSTPLQRKYMKNIELWLLKRLECLYLIYPWSLLLKMGTKGVAESDYGRKLMLDMMMTYNGDKKRYAKIIGHGYKILAESMEEDLPYHIQCPALLICGKNDKAGSTIRLNKAWHENSRIPIQWVENAGHNANTDQPEIVNQLIESFLKKMSLFHHENCENKSLNLHPVSEDKG